MVQKASEVRVKIKMNWLDDLALNASSIKIAICGVHGSGKSTLIEQLKSDEYFSCYKFLPSFSSSLIKNKNHSENTTSELQEQMLERSFSQARNIKNSPSAVICDRCFIDALVYTKATNTLDLNPCREFLHEAIKVFDYYFICDADGIKLEDNNIRSLDVEFRNKVNQLYLSLQSSRTGKFYILPSNIDRMKLMKVVMRIKEN